MSDPIPRHPRAGDPADDQIVSGVFKLERFGDRAFLTVAHISQYPDLTRIEIALDDFEAVKSSVMTARQLARKMGPVSKMHVENSWKLVAGGFALAAALILLGPLTAKENLW